jgi:hypothetical protein
MQLQLSPAHPDYGKVGFAELEDRIRKRAYDLYEQPGHVHGYELEDWLEAKASAITQCGSSNQEYAVRCNTDWRSPA